MKLILNLGPKVKKYIDNLFSALRPPRYMNRTYFALFGAQGFVDMNSGCETFSAYVGLVGNLMTTDLVLCFESHVCTYSFGLRLFIHQVLLGARAARLKQMWVWSWTRMLQLTRARIGACWHLP